MQVVADGGVERGGRWKRSAPYIKLAAGWMYCKWCCRRGQASGSGHVFGRAATVWTRHDSGDQGKQGVCRVKVHIT